MASTLTRILLHITFSTKDRADLLTPAIEPDLYAYIGGICRNLDSPLLDMNGTANHVHLFVSLSKTLALSAFLQEVKRDSSKWLHSVAPGMHSFHWQDGYFAFSLGESGAAALRRYFAGQKQHHESVDYKDEVRSLLRKYNLEWDERYIWT